MQEFKEMMHRGMNLTIRDESNDEREEGQAAQEEEEEKFLTQKRKGFSKPLPRLRKDLSSMLPHF